MAYKYITSMFIIDFFAVFPYLFGTVFLLMAGKDFDEIKKSGFMVFASYLRILRIFHIPRITDFQKSMLNNIKDRFSSSTYETTFLNLHIMITFFLYFLLSIHILTCILLYATFEKNPTIDHTQPFTYEMSLTQYSEFVYFITTTTTTIGYGDMVANFELDSDTDHKINLFTLMMFI